MGRTNEMEELASYSVGVDSGNLNTLGLAASARTSKRKASKGPSTFTVPLAYTLPKKRSDVGRSKANKSTNSKVRSRRGSLNLLGRKVADNDPWVRSLVSRTTTGCRVHWFSPNVSRGTPSTP